MIDVDRIFVGADLEIRRRRHADAFAVMLSARLRKVSGARRSFIHSRRCRWQAANANWLLSSARWHTIHIARHAALPVINSPPGSRLFFHGKRGNSSPSFSCDCFVSTSDSGKKTNRKQEHADFTMRILGLTGTCLRITDCRLQRRDDSFLQSAADAVAWHIARGEGAVRGRVRRLSD